MAMKKGDIFKLLKGFKTGISQFKKGELVEFLEYDKVASFQILKFKTHDGRKFNITTKRKEEYIKPA